MPRSKVPCAARDRSHPRPPPSLPRVIRKTRRIARAHRIARHNGTERGRPCRRTSATMRWTAGNTVSRAAPPRRSKRSEQSSGFACTPSFRSNQLHRSSLVPSSLQHDFVQRILDDACGAAALSFGITSRAMRSSTIVLTATHSELLSCDTVGELSAGSTASTASRSCALHVQHQAHLRLCVDRAAQHQRDLVDLFALPRICEC